MYGDYENIWEVNGKWKVECRIKLDDGGYKKVQRVAHTEREAKQKLKELQGDAKKLVGARAEKVNMETLIGYYVDFKRNRVRDTTLGNYIYLLKAYVLPTFARKDPHKLTATHMDAWLESLHKRGFTPKTVNTIRARLYDVFKYAKSRINLESNPLEFVSPYKVNSNSPSMVCEPWDLAEAKTALAAFRNTPLDLFVSIAVSTGMRKGEILALKWSDLNESAKTFRVNKSRGESRVMGLDGVIRTRTSEDDTKTRASNRTLKLNPVIEAAIARTISANPSYNKQGYLITNSASGPMSPGRLRILFNRICNEKGLRQIRIHDLRHTSAVVAMESGAALEEVSQALGHSGVEITKRTYAQIVPVLADRFTNKLSDALLSEDEDEDEANPSE